MTLFKELKKIAVERKITRHVKIAVVSTICRVIFILINFFNVRLLTDQLGIENYAFYTVLLSLLGWFSLLDFGIGSSMQNYMSEQKASGKSYEQYIQSAFLFGLIITVPVILLSYYFVPLVSQAILKNFHQIPEKQKNCMLQFVFIVNIIYTMSGMVIKVWFAEKRSHFYFIITTLSILVSFILFYFLRFVSTENKLFYAVIFGALPQAVIITFFFLAKAKLLFKAKSDLKFHNIRNLVKRASGFWFISILGVINSNIDGLIVARYTTPNFIASYNLIGRFYSNAFVIYSQLLLAAWPIFSEKLQIREISTIKEKLINYTSIGVLSFVILGVGMWFTMPYIVGFLMPNLKQGIPGNLIILFTVWYLIRVFTDTLGILFNSASDTKTLIYVGVTIVPLSIFLQIFFISKIGPYGVIIGIITAYILTAVWFYPLRASRLFKKKISNI